MESNLVDDHGHPIDIARSRYGNLLHAAALSPLNFRRGIAAPGNVDLERGVSLEITPRIKSSYDRTATCGGESSLAIVIDQYVILSAVSSTINKSQLFRVLAVDRHELYDGHARSVAH